MNKKTRASSKIYLVFSSLKKEKRLLRKSIEPMKSAINFCGNASSVSHLWPLLVISSPGPRSARTPQAGQTTCIEDFGVQDFVRSDQQLEIIHACIIDPNCLSNLT